MITFDELMANWNWQPIRNCPGRYAFRAAPPDLSIEALLGGDPEVTAFDVPAARDTVLVSSLDRGGVISYRRRDGTYLHTLNDNEGFRRKLLQLEIIRDELEGDHNGHARKREV